MRDLKEHELQRLSDEDLIDRIRMGRAAGKPEATRAALRQLVFGYFDILLARARLKLPDSAAEDVVADALESAIKSAFDGQSIGEFRAWMHTILARRIAEHYRAKEGKPTLLPLPTYGGGLAQGAGHEPLVDGPDGTIVDVRNAVIKAYGELSDAHRKVVDLYVFSQYSAAETTERTGKSEGNVHQIASRFRRSVATLVAAEPEPEPEPTTNAKHARAKDSKKATGVTKAKRKAPKRKANAKTKPNSKEQTVKAASP